MDEEIKYNILCLEKRRRQQMKKKYDENINKIRQRKEEKMELKELKKVCETEQLRTKKMKSNSRDLMILRQLASGGDLVPF